jgi:hypothetical protein
MSAELVQAFDRKVASLVGPDTDRATPGYVRDGS